MNQFGWLLERGSGGRTNFFNLLQKDEVPRKGGGGVPTLEETMQLFSIEKTKLYMYKVNSFIDRKRQICTVRYTLAYIHAQTTI